MSREQQIMSILQYLSPGSLVETLEKWITEGRISDPEDRKIVRRIYLDLTERKAA